MTNQPKINVKSTQINVYVYCNYKQKNDKINGQQLQVFKKNRYFLDNYFIYTLHTTHNKINKV